MQFNHLKIAISFLLLISSCHYTSKRKPLSSSALENIRQEFSLPKERTFRLDTNYIHYLFSLDTAKYASQIHDHYQPIQATYYDKAGRLISFHINCYAGIDTKDYDDLNWNQLNVFASFPPKSIVPIDTILPLIKHLQFIKTFDNNVIDTTGFSEFDYTVIIHWGKNWRSKDSRNLFKIVTENTLLAKDKKVNILYVNNDNTW